MKKYWSAKELIHLRETPASERTGFRFWVVADGIGRGVKTMPSLEKIVSVIFSERPHVFRNADKGITIDFD